MVIDETPLNWILLEAHIYGTVCDEARLSIGMNCELLHRVICMQNCN